MKPNIANRDFTFGVVLTITNPLSSGYLAFFAALEAWDKIADEIIIVDGGSDDGTIEYLNDKYSNNKNIRLISNETTYWGKGDNWYLFQMEINLNYGLSKLQTDWAFAFSSDYIPYNWTKEKLKNELMKYKDEFWVRTFVGKPYFGKIYHRINQRNIIFNNRRIKEIGMIICYGTSTVDGLSDFPIHATEVAYFLDKFNNKTKYIFRGEPVVSNKCIDLECIAFGHFFYTKEQLKKKIIRWDRAYCRYSGDPENPLYYLMLKHKVPLRWGKHFAKEEIQKMNLPVEIKNIIEEFNVTKPMFSIRDNNAMLFSLFRTVLYFLLDTNRKAKKIIRKKIIRRTGISHQLIWNKIGKAE